MKNLYIKQKVMSIRGRFTVTDDVIVDEPSVEIFVNKGVQNYSFNFV